MFARIKHAAIYTQSPEATITFYEKLLGMKQIATAVMESNRSGHISDGLIGLAVLARRPGIPAGLDHFGFEVDDITTVLDRIRKNIRRRSSRKDWREFPLQFFAATIRPARNSIFPSAPMKKSERATRKVAGINRASSTTS